ncbi:3-methylaspartate ammonia-lyase [Sphingobium sp. SCG-1]|uniref:acyclic terpene utilization AtuA family protein n=1 Tax=Sphingobium sp. SCG-1 TaxID=2072936 RepID=UPI000CD69199|nr:acyclic terpene utilization AtuA family protein [Sphingobium sp. SCG-1]AUW57157.1 3-methylaspartate ammonia-lyase [Sphingobium sp. SCG-1]
MRESKILATCTLGLGFSYNGFRNGLDLAPDLIACDAGSADFGPYFLGTGKLQKSKETLKRDLRLLLQGARELAIPFITGSAGGAGARPQLDALADLVREVAREDGLNFRMAVIPAEVSRERIRNALHSGHLAPVGSVTPLNDELLAATSAAVAMMGVEPFQAALEAGADVIIAGRATDPSIFSAVAIRAGLPAGAVWHAAKCIDKGYLATTRPQDGSPVLATIDESGFTIVPTREGSVCTVKTVAGITLHENSDPFRVVQPTGMIDTELSRYEQIDDRSVRVTGSRYIATEHPTLKLEGARRVGFRKLLIAGLRDPRLLERLDEYMDAYRAAIARAARSLGFQPDDYILNFRAYGRDAVMGPLEPLRDQVGHEIGFVVDLVGKTEAVTNALASRLGPTGSRLDIHGRMGGGGNFAYPFSPSIIDMGAVYEWSLWHIMGIEPGELTSLFPIEMEDV